MNSWYPSGLKLVSLLQRAYDAADVSSVDKNGNLRSIIVPHAGYEFCVKTSMHAFKCIDPSKYDRVFILGPSHFIRINSCIVVSASAAETPFGDVPIDTEATKQLLNDHPGLFKAGEPKVVEVEHSLEMELPLLKFIFKDKKFSVVPIMVGSISFDKCSKVAEALKAYADDPKTLFVISSDFCHWGDNFGYKYLPKGDGPIYKRIEKMDMEATEMIATGEPVKFNEYIKRTNNTICGRNPILIMMNMFKNYKAQFPAYSQSSNIVDEDDYSVSYVAGVIKTN